MFSYGSAMQTNCKLMIKLQDFMKSMKVMYTDQLTMGKEHIHEDKARRVVSEETDLNIKGL